MARTRQEDDVVEIVHRELCHASLQSCAAVDGLTVCDGAEAADDAAGVLQSLQALADGLAVDDGVWALAIVVGLRIGESDRLSPQQQLRGELLVLVVDARSEAQVAKDAAAEEIATGRAPDVLAAHILAARRWLAVVPDGLGVCLRRVCEAEDHQLGLMAPQKVEAVGVGCLQEGVVGIDELEVGALCHLDARIACLAQSLVVLTDIDDVVAIAHELVHRTEVRAVVDNDDLSLGSGQRELHDAVDALAEHRERQVVIGYDKADERLGHRTI